MILKRHLRDQVRWSTILKNSGRKQNGNTFFYSRTSNYNKDSHSRYVEFDAHIKTPGFYKVDAKVLARTPKQDSFFVSVNGNFSKRWNVPKHKKPRFRTVENSLYLHKGLNKIRFNHRESLTYIADLKISFQRGIKAVYAENFSSRALPWKRGRNLNLLSIRSPGHLRAEYVPFERGSMRVLSNKSFRPSDEYTLTYKVRFNHDFDFKRGGKLHGLGPVRKSTGCTQKRADGWSSRVTFKSRGRVSLYLYDQDRSNRCGHSYGTKNDFRFEKGKWYTVSLYTKLNRPSRRSNGQAKLYIDGKQLIEVNNIKFRRTTSSRSKISQFLFSTFHGGSGPQWAPGQIGHADFDDFEVVKGDYPKK